MLARVVEGVVAAQHALLLLAAPPDALEAVHVRAGLVERERRRAVDEPLQELVGPVVGIEASLSLNRY